MCVCDCGVSVVYVCVYGVKVLCCFVYLYEIVVKGLCGDVGVLDMVKISFARDILGKIFSSASRGLIDVNDL